MQKLFKAKEKQPLTNEQTQISINKNSCWRQNLNYSRCIVPGENKIKLRK